MHGKMSASRGQNQRRAAVASVTFWLPGSLKFFSCMLWVLVNASKPVLKTTSLIIYPRIKPD